MKQIARFGMAVFLLACGPGEYASESELRAADVCRSFCDVRTTCDPDVVEGDGCFDTCMGLPMIEDKSPCGSEEREVYACIGELSCEGFGVTMTAGAPQDPCGESKLRFSELRCGAEVSP